MAGYIFSLDSLDSLHRYTTNGVYGTKLSAPSHSWVAHHEGTFADYTTMRAGDNIYFFIQRKIYGIGKLVNVGSDCKFFNFPGASNAQAFAYLPLRPTILWDEGDVSINQRCICVFEPDPYFFRDYAMIRAFFVAYDFDQNAVEHKRTVGVRRYTVGVRPAQSLEWSNVKLVRYAFNAPLNRIDFTVTD